MLFKYTFAASAAAAALLGAAPASALSLFTIDVKDLNQKGVMFDVVIGGRMSL